MQKRAWLLLLIVCGVARAQTPPPSTTDEIPAPPPAPVLSPDEQKALEKALGADAAAQSKQTPTISAANPQSATVPAATTSTNPLVRAFQSLNPDIAAILDFAGGYYSNPDRTLKNGDDPQDTAINIQEVEIALQAVVDPYFRADLFLTIPNLKGIEVEEAYLTTTSLPASLQFKVGIFRAPFGRQNTQHLHLQDFTRRPAMNALFLGADGLRSPGLEVSWLAPVPFYLLITGAAFSVSPTDDPTAPPQSFGGGERKDFTYLGNVKTFASLSDTTSLLFGLSFATGNSFTRLAPLAPGGSDVIESHRSFLYGADLYVKWKPVNVSQTWMSLAWTTEFMLRHLPEIGTVDGGLYSQLVWQADRRWFIGLRGEVDGIPQDALVVRQYAGSASLTWALSEFARIRLYGEVRYQPSNTLLTEAAFLQFEAAIGAHGAHPY